MIQGVLAAFLALPLSVLVEFGRASLVDWTTIGFATVAAIALWWKIDPPADRRWSGDSIERSQH